MSARAVSSTRGGWAIAALMLSCGGASSPTQATLTLVTGKESDALTRAPLPARLVVAKRSGAGAPAPIVDVAWPAADFDLGTLTAGSAYAFSAELRDAAGTVIVRGETPAVSGGEVGANGLALLLGRVGEPARPSGGLHAAWVTPRATAVGRYAFVASPDADASELYDFVALAALGGRAKLPRRPATVTSADGRHVLLLDAAGATLLDVAAGTTAESPLDGVAPGELLGGAAIVGDDGAYLVGATRAFGDATRAVLRLGTDGSLRAVSLATARVGAFATWAPGLGLVVGGGAPAAPLEVLAPGGSAFSALGGVVGGAGGAAVALGDGTIVLLGGRDDGGAARAPVRLTLPCAATCIPVALGAAVDVAFGLGFAGAAGHGVVVGAASDGGTVIVRATTTAAGVSLDLVPLRVARRDAAAIALGNGYVALLGGTDAGGAAVGDVELIIPP